MQVHARALGAGRVAEGSLRGLPQVSEFYPNRPWQCLNFFPEPQGQTSLRPTLPQVAGSLGSRATAELMAAPALRARVATASDIARSSSPVAGLMCRPSMNGRLFGPRRRARYIYPRIC